MIDIAITFAVVVCLVLMTALLAARYERSIRPYVWLALVEYLSCAVYQYLNGADANGYRQAGQELAKFLDANFSWASGEMISLIIHRPSAFDDLAIGAGTNTASMCGAAAWLIFFARGSVYAVQALVAGLAMFGSIAIFDAFRDACPEVAPRRLFAATVLFPSIAFWVSALHKEAFCLMGMGLLLAAWRGAYRRRPSAIVYGVIGLALVGMFRAPVLAPLLLGFVVYYVSERVQRTRGAGGAGGAMAKPLYFFLGIAALALGTLAVGRISPELAIDQLSHTVAQQQRGWIQIADEGYGGGSGFGLDAPVVESLGSQLASAPLSLVNALFRPQFFDVKSPRVVVAAVEMTVITVLLIVVFRRHGLRGVLSRVQGSPFLLMCAVVTIVGCTFIGLTTRNFGTLVRYRVPFLPFYGSLLAGLLTQRSSAPVASTARGRGARRAPPPRRGARPMAPALPRTGSK